MSSTDSVAVQAQGAAPAGQSGAAFVIRALGEHYGLPSQSKSVLLAVAALTDAMPNPQAENGRQGGFTASPEAIEHVTGLSEESVTAAVNALADLGLLTRTGGGARLPDGYRSTQFALARPDWVGADEWQSVPCPHCRAARGRPCVRPGGEARERHKGRDHAVLRQRGRLVDPDWG